MYILYADESGNTGTDYENKEQPIFVLGGLIVEDKKWHEINKIFKDTNFIQIADIYSFYINKYFSIKSEYKKYSDIKQQHCIDIYKKLSTKTNFINSEFLF